MGVYAVIRPECELPDLPPGVDSVRVEWQTKDLEPGMLDTYRIRADGVLEHQDYDVEDRSDKTLPEGDMRRIIGCMTQVNKRWVPEVVTCIVRFYSFEKHRLPESIEYEAEFVDGRLQRMKRLEIKSDV